MSRPRVLLVNPNRMLPPIGPLGLEFVADELQRNGYDPVLCDLTFAEDWPAAVTKALDDTRPIAVGVSVRNLDDAYFASRDFVLQTTAQVIRHIKEAIAAPVVLGGVGFSCAPREALRYTGADYGLVGDGDHTFPLLLERLQTRAAVDDVPGAVFRTNGNSIVVTRPAPRNLDAMPAPTRWFADNVRYFHEGGQSGVETKRGCPNACIYCIEPHSKGAVLRLRSAESVADEFAALLDLGIDAVHLCDSEFNLPEAHARAVCDVLVRRGLGSRLRWYTYASPHPFSVELAQAMQRAGCRGVNFGVDHADETMLRRLGRTYGPEHIRAAVQACRAADIAVMLDLLLGAPGETRDTIVHTLDFVKQVNPDCAGLSCGVRVYPNTPLAGLVRTQGPFEKNPHLYGAVLDNDDLLRPVFYVDAGVGADIHRYVTTLVNGDARFFHADPSQVEGNYNYNDNSVLMQAIRGGARGAYWDILRRARS